MNLESLTELWSQLQSLQEWLRRTSEHYIAMYCSYENGMCRVTLSGWHRVGPEANPSGEPDGDKLEIRGQAFGSDEMEAFIQALKNMDDDTLTRPALRIINLPSVDERAN